MSVAALESRPVGRLRRRVGAPVITGALIIGASLVLAVVPGWFAPYDPIAFDYAALLQPPSPAHPFGTDNFGRDVLSRVIWGYRLDMQIAFFGTIFSILFGCLIGALVGYYGGWSDAVFGRVVDAVITFPFLVLVIAIVAVLGPGLINMYIAVGVVGWVFYARLLRAEIQIQKQQDYASARKSGRAASTSCRRGWCTRPGCPRAP